MDFGFYNHRFIEITYRLLSITERLVITDYGNLQYAVDEELLQQQRQHYHHIRNYADFMACNLALIAQVQQMLQQNAQFLTIGGDHAIGFGAYER